MEPYQVHLFAMTMSLLAPMLIGGVVTAWLLRDYFNWGTVIGSFVTAIALIFVMVGVSHTGNAVLIMFVSLLFGGAIGATLGGFVVAVTHGRRRGAEAVAITLAVVAMSTVAAAIVGMMSGFNFQGLGGVLFVGLLFLIGLGVLALFVRFNKTMEFVVGIGASVFWMIYLVYDFNKVVDKYTEATWPAAAEIAMNIYLDMVNLFVRLLPIIVEILDATD